MNRDIVIVIFMNFIFVFIDLSQHPSEFSDIIRVCFLFSICIVLY